MQISIMNITGVCMCMFRVCGYGVGGLVRPTLYVSVSLSVFHCLHSYMPAQMYKCMCVCAMTGKDSRHPCCHEWQSGLSAPFG